VQAIIAEATQVVEAEEDRVFGTGERLWRAGGGAWKELEEAPDFSQESVREKGWQNKGDGLFGEYVGYAPIYKSGYDLDMSKSRSKNIEHAGSGELGRIMGLLNWYNLEEGAGYSKVNMPSWDKPMWDPFPIFGNEDWMMEAPSFAGAVDLVVQAVATIATAPVGGFGGAVLGAAIGSVDDLMFTALEVGTGYILPEQGLFQMGQTLLKAGVQVAMSGVMNGWDTWDATIPGSEKIGGIFGAVGDNFVGKSFATLGQQLVTNTANGFIDANSLEIEDGKVVGWRVDTDQWTESVVGKNAIAGYVGSFVQAGTKSFLQELTPEIDLLGIDVGDPEGLHALTKTADVVSSTLSSITGEAIGSLFDGEFTLNLVNLSDFASLLGADDPSQYNMGLFEIGFSADGVRSRFGSGGASLNLVSTIQGIGSLIEIGNINSDARQAKEVKDKMFAKKPTELTPEDNTFEGISRYKEKFKNALEVERMTREVRTSPRIRIPLASTSDDHDIVLPGIPEVSQREKEVQEIIREVKGDPNAEAKLTDLLRSLLGETNVTSAENFMKEFVTEEGLDAFNFDEVVGKILSGSENWSARDLAAMEHGICQHS
jgi:hypothetical protein